MKRKKVGRIIPDPVGVREFLVPHRLTKAEEKELDSFFKKKEREESLLNRKKKASRKHKPAVA